MRRVARNKPRSAGAVRPPVAVVGTGVIGRSWIQVFARAGHPTRIYDADSSQLKRAVTWLERDLEHAVRDRVLKARAAAGLRARVTIHRDLAEALAGVVYVQESGPE